MSEHPNIYVPKLKEPYFLAEDFSSIREVKTLGRYQQLFQLAQEQHSILVDGSVLYMYSAVAIENIFRFNPDANLLVMVRNPLNMLHSSYARLLATFSEDERDFEKVWRLQLSRRRNENIPAGCRTSALLQYRDVGKVGAQLQRVLNVFPRSQVCIILFDDFVKSPRNAYNEVLDFLGVARDERSEFSQSNQNIQGFRVRWLASVLRNPPKRVKRFERKVKKLSKIETFGVVALAEKWLGKRAPRLPLSAGFRAELVDEFRDDIRQLSTILGRDLRHWH